jgi:threonine dehydrogenase-like Zn-dependent dehydrogenase
LAERHGARPIDASSGDAVEQIRELTSGRGADSVIDAVGMEAHGSRVTATAQRAVGLLPDPLARALTERAGFDRLGVLHSAIDAVRRGGTVSVSGVYGGMIDPMPMMTMFDKGITLRMGQANVKAWIPELLPLVTDDADPLGTGDLATHHLPLDQAPDAYRMFQQKADAAIKVLFKP